MATADGKTLHARLAEMALEMGRSTPGINPPDLIEALGVAYVTGLVALHCQKPADERRELLMRALGELALTGIRLIYPETEH